MTVVDLVVLVAISTAVAFAENDPKLPLEMLREKMGNDSYDRTLRPINKLPNGTLTGVEVKTEIYLRSITNINMQTSSFDVNFELSHFWHDPRLELAQDDPIELEDGRGIVWLPDTSFYYLIADKSPMSAVQVRIFGNGTVWSIQSRIHTLPCKFDVSYFPFDHVECKMLMGSSAHTTRDIVLSWTKNAVLQLNDLTMTDFAFTRVSYVGRRVHYSTGEISELVVTLKFVRVYGHFLSQFVIPTLGLVFLSWLTFWFPRKQPVVKTIVATTSLLIISALAILARAEMPKHSILSALDVWFFGCILFIAYPVVDVAFLSCLTRPRKRTSYSLEKRLLAGEAPSLGRKQRRCALCFQCTGCFIYLILFALFLVFYHLRYFAKR